jgi:hypothetical protein
MIRTLSLNRLLSPFRIARAPHAESSRGPGDVASDPDTAQDSANSEFLRQLHPLHRQFLAYRLGLLDGQPHTLEDTAARFGIAPAVARVTDEYLQARRRLHLDRAGWRAARIVSG